MNANKFLMKRAKGSSSPKKYMILAYIMIRDHPPTAREIGKALKIKLTTVNSYLNTLFHEAEIDHHDYYFDSNDQYIKTKEFVYSIEREFNEQPSLMSGLFMTQKEYDVFKNNQEVKEWLIRFKTESPEYLIKLKRITKGLIKI